MVYPQIIYFVVTLVLSIALAPKPRPPRAASIDDFEFPTAEEGRSIPVVFGDVEVTGPNVLWYGDLSIKPIKKRAGFSKATIGYKYYIGFHMGLCHGPVDAVTAVTVDRKLAFTGNITGNGSGQIIQPELLGGKTRGGGIVGEFDIAMGADDQTANAYLLSSIGEPIPAYRGIVSFIWKAVGQIQTGTSARGQAIFEDSGYIGNSEQVRPFGIRLKRIVSGWQNAVWYPEAAEVDGGMNPAHILYQVLTDSEWGMGLATNLIDDANFRETADQLVSENFGMHLLWNQTTTVEKFIEIILNHVSGALTLRIDTGLYQVRLFRGGYDPDALPVFDPSNVIDLRRFEKQGWGETVNEVTLIYTDPDTLQDTSIAAQDLGNVDAQGSRVPATVELKGIRNHDIAHEVLARELAARTSPLTKIQFTVNRAAWVVGFGDLFRFTWPERNCENRVFRILRVGKGTMQDNTIFVEALEDIYQYTFGAGISTQPVVVPETAPETPEESDTNTPFVISAATATPPSGSPGPQDGDRYYIPAGATDEWVGHEGQLAEWSDEDGDWVYSELSDGTIFAVEDTSPQTTVQIIEGQPQTLTSGMADPGSSGIVVRTALNVTTARTIADTANIAWTNPGGQAGNPSANLTVTGVTPGAYTNTDLIVDAFGRVTFATDGTGGGGSGGTNFYYRSTPPGSASPAESPPITLNEGDRWVDSDTGIMYTYIDDGSSAQWVEFNA